VVKFESENAKMNIYGTLNATGTAANKIVFTSLKDGGATTPAPGDWGYIRLYGYIGNDGIGIFEHCILRYGGSHATYSANVYSYFSDSFSFKNSVSEYSAKNGIYLQSTNGGDIISNTIANNTQYGVYLASSNNNLIYNNYFNNTNNAWDNGNNIWNISKTPGTNIIDGPYLGGNYWSDYPGRDLDGDELGDTDLPYNSYGDIQNGGDWHPLVERAPDLVISDTWVYTGNCTICYNVTNIGNEVAPACHNTTLYVDGVEVAQDHVPVDLEHGESYVGCFDDYTWTYTLPSDNITVCADNNDTLNESDETNNCLANIWTCGDVNDDGKVTMSDVRKVFNRYLDPNYPLDLPWAADVNCNGKVTMSDVRKVFNRYLDPGYDLNCCCEGAG
jgi:parallel beta-helix repeat protein